MAAQDLGFTSIRDEGHSTACCMKVETAMKRCEGMNVGKRSKRRCLRSKKSVGEQLLPGIPDEITLDLIIPKLLWRDSLILSSVSRCWEEAVRTKRVYEARVRANLTEKLIIHIHQKDERYAIALYSTSDKCCYELPQIHWLPREMLKFCCGVISGGKIYILGGTLILGGEFARAQRLKEGNGSVGEVYMLDLAGGRQKWEQCASMLVPRTKFACGIIDGKIYACGGRSLATKDLGKELLQSEVYDTQKNAWSPMMPMIRNLVNVGVAAAAAAVTVGKEPILYYTRDSTLGVYNPAKNEWRLVKSFWREQSSSLVFTTKGRFYSFSQSGIDVYDDKENSWINRHTNSFATVQPGDSAHLQPISILAVADELFLTAYWYIGGRNSFARSIQCKGFDGEKNEIVWQKTNCSFAITGYGVLQCCIEL